jgi:glycosyltransferase involved in cell wall biosynthesis
MKVLMLSTDENILREGTEARGRMTEYSGLFDELHVVVLAAANTQYPISNIQKDGKLFLYPTNSRNKLLALLDAYRIGKKIFLDNEVRLPRPAIGGSRNDSLNSGWAISAQDPFELGLVGYLLKKKFNAPLQLQVHTDFLSPYFWHESWKNKIRVLLAKWLLPKANGMRVVSERIGQSLKAISYKLEAVNVLPIFVDIEKIKNLPIKTNLREKYPQFDFIILMASRLSREKNIGMAIDAMSGIIERYPKTGLIIVGSGPALHSLEAISYKLKANILIEPWTDDLASYYKTADLFLLTSFYEGYGRTIIEAMAAGLPVVMSDVGVAGDLVKDGENGYVVDSGDKRGLIERIVKLIERPDLRKEFSMKNSNAVKTLPTKEEYLSQYKNILFRMTNS